MNLEPERTGFLRGERRLCRAHAGPPVDISYAVPGLVEGPSVRVGGAAHSLASAGEWNYCGSESDLVAELWSSDAASVGRSRYPSRVRM